MRLQSGNSRRARHSRSAFILLNDLLNEAFFRKEEAETQEVSWLWHQESTSIFILKNMRFKHLSGSSD